VADHQHHLATYRRSRIDGIVIWRVIGTDVAAAAADQSTIMPRCYRVSAMRESIINEPAIKFFDGVLSALGFTTRNLDSSSSIIENDRCRCLGLNSRLDRLMIPSSFDFISDRASLISHRQRLRSAAHSLEFQTSS